MKTDKFVVAAIGKGLMYFEEAQNAVDWASSVVYVNPDAKCDAVNALNEGRLAQWAYGFNEVTIYPPGTEVR